MNHIDLEAVAVAFNPKALTCPLVTEGIALDALKNLVDAVAVTLMSLDREQRPAEPARGDPDQSWYVPAHEPRPLTYEQQRLITTYVQAREALLVAAIKHPDYMYCRARGHSVMTTYIYHRNTKSPSGVQCFVAGPSDKVDPLVRLHRNNSPLSPTEGLRRVG